MNLKVHLFLNQKIKIMNSIELKKEFTDEETGISYTLVGNYYVPNLVLKQEEKVILNKYGRLRLNYLKEHKKTEYAILFMEEQLNKHLKEIQEVATKIVNDIMTKLKAKRDLTEDMKDSNQLYWVGTMNSIKQQAEEIVLNELIYT